MKIDIKEWVKNRKEEIAAEVSAMDRKPRLLILQMGDNPASNSYIKGKIGDAGECGIAADLFKANTFDNMAEFVLRVAHTYDGVILQEPSGLTEKQRDYILGLMEKHDVTDEEIINVLTAMGGDKLIKKYPDGIHQELSRKGVNMSAGEKQLISLARVLIHDPSILIMDEATSHIDLETEEMVKNALNIVSKNRTVIVIAHRLSTVFDADKIIVLDHGIKVEEGTHADLVKKNGVYANIYRAQTANINRE